jgi:hypothetical protein
MQDTEDFEVLAELPPGVHLPTFCPRCGADLVRTKTEIGFSPFTGRIRLSIDQRCPNRHFVPDSHIGYAYRNRSEPGPAPAKRHWWSRG